MNRYIGVRGTRLANAGPKSPGKFIHALSLALIICASGCTSEIDKKKIDDGVVSECDRVWPLAEPFADLTREKPDLGTLNDAFNFCSPAFEQDQSSPKLKFRFGYLWLATNDKNMARKDPEAAKQAMKLIREAAEAGEPSAELFLAMLPQENYSLSQMEQHRRHWLERAANHGQPRAMVLVAVDYWKRGRPKSKESMTRAVELAAKALPKIQHIESKSVMLAILVDGSNSRIKIEKYLGKLELLAYRGSIPADTILSAVYLTGLYLPDNLKSEFMTFENGMRHIETLAKKGDALSQTIIKKLKGRRYNNTLIIMALVCSSHHRRRSKYYVEVIKSCQ